jgi:hypothetical protein
MGRKTMEDLIIVYGMSVDFLNDLTWVGFLLLGSRRFFVNMDRESAVTCRWSDYEHCHYDVEATYLIGKVAFRSKDACRETAFTVEAFVGLSIGLSPSTAANSRL